MLDGGFKLQEKICTIFYALQVLSTDLFIYHTQTQREDLTEDFADTFGDFFPKLNRYSY